MTKNKLAQDERYLIAALKEEKNQRKPIVKNLDQEQRINQLVSYYPLCGASKMSNYAAPDSYVFLLFEKASGVHSVDFIDYEQRDLQLHISFPEQIHSWDTGPDALGHKLIIDKKLVEESKFSAHFSMIRTNKFPVIDIDNELFQKLASEFITLKDDLEFYSDTLRWNMAKERLQLILLLVTHLIKEINLSSSNTKVEHILIRFSELVEQNFKHCRSVGEYAKKLNLSANYLNVLCRKQLQMTAKELISHRIILEARRLLKNTDINIKVLGFELGFSEVANFANFFKRYTGKTPTQIREEQAL